LDFKNPKSDPSEFLTGEALKGMYLEWVKEFPIVSIEDPFDQDDWEAWTAITASTPIQVCQNH
jgi:enolase